MSDNHESTTLVCLFHSEGHAQQVLKDLRAAAISPSSMTVIGGGTPVRMQHASLEQFGIPTRDLAHLKEGLESGGTIVVVTALAHEVGTVEKIFAEGKAAKIDEIAMTNVAPVAAALAPTDAAIPIVEEQLEVDKRVVDRGGVHVYTRIAEIPAEASVTLREEHAVIERKAVDRPATEADLAQANRSVVLTETAEEVVIGKTARVVEEITLSKEMTEHTERIHDTVRRTEVDIEELRAEDTLSPTSKAL